jgi:CRISPR-associated protein Csm3
MPNISLKGKIIVTGKIRTVTGLHIGGAAAGLDIGGIDNPIIRHPVTREPYIPGSSLRGKMRSLLDRNLGNEINHPIRRENPPVRIHECKEEASYAQCPVCQVFGLTPGGDRGERSDWTTIKPTRLLVRDVSLLRKDAQGNDAADNEQFFKAKFDLPYTEVKWEAVIDRITSAAVPRQNERVPAGAVFGPFEFVYSIYDVNGEGAESDVKWLRHVFEGMQLIEDDYIGGYGSRGTGKIAFESLEVIFKSPACYKGEAEPQKLVENQPVSELAIDALQEQINTLIAG